MCRVCVELHEYVPSFIFEDTGMTPIRGAPKKKKRRCACRHGRAPIWTCETPPGKIRVEHRPFSMQNRKSTAGRRPSNINFAQHMSKGFDRGPKDFSSLRWALFFTPTVRDSWRRGIQNVCEDHYDCRPCQTKIGHICTLANRGENGAGRMELRSYLAWLVNSSAPLRSDQQMAEQVSDEV